MPYTIEQIKKALRKYIVIQDDEYHLWCGGERMHSPSSIIGKLCPFPLYRMSENCAKTKDTDNKYYGKCAEEIREGWSEKAQIASSRGRLSDTFTQNLWQHKYSKSQWDRLKHKNFIVDNDVKTGALDFYDKFKDIIDVVGTECTIAYPAFKVAGRTDMLCVIRTKGIITGITIIDWKTNTSDILSTKSRMAKPANKYYKNVVDKASLQLAIYKLIIEEAYGLHVHAVRTVLLGDKCNDVDNELSELKTPYTRGDNWIAFDSTIPIDNEATKKIIKTA